MNVVGVESLKGEGLELRFLIKLRVQNPNDSPIEYDGISIELDVNGKTLASGVSGERGTVPRFGEAIVTVPVSISAISATRAVILSSATPRLRSGKARLSYTVIVS